MLDCKTGKWGEWKQEKIRDKIEWRYHLNWKQIKIISFIAKRDKRGINLENKYIYIFIFSYVLVINTTCEI